MFRKYGWNRDRSDGRDKRLRLAPGKLADLPPRWDLRPKMPAVYSQLTLGSCTAQVVCGLLHYRQLNDAHPYLFAPSRLFTYYNTRAQEGKEGEDAGASIRDTVKSVADRGFCDERLWPYLVEKYALRPSADAYEAAVKYRVIDYSRVDQFGNSIKACLVAGDPIALGVGVYESFESDAVVGSGVVTVPEPSELALGGHAIMLVGYDDLQGWFVFRNSYDLDWGDKGYGYLPYRYVLNPNLCDDLWTIRTIP